VTQFDDDLAEMFTDLPSVTLVIGETSVQAFRDLSDANTLPGVASHGVSAATVMVTFPTAAYADLAIGTAVTVDGVPFTVIDVDRAKDHLDGAVSYALLQAAS